MKIPWWRKLLYAAMLAVMGIGALEWLLRGPLDPDGGKRFATLLELSEPHAQPRAWALVPGRETESGVRVNALGFVGPEIEARKPAGTYRIFALGDSCNYARPGHSYVEQLGRLLDERVVEGRRIEVVNAGCIGYSIEKSLAWFQEQIRDLEPDAITVYLGWNNLQDARRYLLGEMPGRLDEEGGRPGRSSEGLLAQSKLARAIEVLEMGTKVPPFTAADPPPPREVTDRAHDELARWEAPRVRRSLDVLLSEASDLGIDSLVLTLPTLMRPGLDEELRQRVVLSYLPDGESEALALAQVNRALREVAGDHGVAVVDLFETFQQRTDFAEHFPFDHIHIWHDGGHRVIACEVLHGLAQFSRLPLRRPLAPCESESGMVAAQPSE